MMSIRDVPECSHRYDISDFTLTCCTMTLDSKVYSAFLLAQLMRYDTKELG